MMDETSQALLAAQVKAEALFAELVVWFFFIA